MRKGSTKQPRKSDILGDTLTQTVTSTPDMITSASYSRLLDFEACAYRADLKYNKRIAVVQHPAAERGSAIHLQAEQFVDGTLKKLPETLKHFEQDFLSLRDHYNEGRVSMEGEWGFDDQWMVTPYKTAWLRMKADAVVLVSPTHAIVIDYKTGRKFGNEIKHGEQIQLYAIATFIRNPQLKTIDVELWYLDKDDLTPLKYTRMQALRYVQSFTARIQKMLSATEFPANPTVHTCKWCDYGPSKGKQCPVGVVPGQATVKLYRNKFTPGDLSWMKRTETGVAA